MHLFSEGYRFESLSEQWPCLERYHRMSMLLPWGNDQKLERIYLDKLTSKATCDILEDGRSLYDDGNDIAVVILERSF